MRRAPRGLGDLARDARLLTRGPARSPRVRRRLLVAALVLCAAGALAAAALVIGDRGEPKQVARRGVGVRDVSKPPKTRKLAPGARRAAQAFILTAVARRNLKRAYALAGPQIRQGQTLAQWLTGDIAVVPYPVGKLDLASMKVDYSYAKEAGIEVALLPKKGASVRATIFSMDLIRRHGRWLVDAWVPRAGPKLPLAPDD